MAPLAVTQRYTPMAATVVVFPQYGGGRLQLSPSYGGDVWGECTKLNEWPAPIANRWTTAELAGRLFQCGGYSYGFEVDGVYTTDRTDVQQTGQWRVVNGNLVIDGTHPVEGDQGATTRCDIEYLTATYNCPLNIGGDSNPELQSHLIFSYDGTYIHRAINPNVGPQTIFDSDPRPWHITEDDRLHPEVDTGTVSAQIDGVNINYPGLSCYLIEGVRLQRQVI